MENVEYTDEQLEQMLQERKAAKAAKRAKEKADYEANRELFVNRVMGEAMSYYALLRDFKTELLNAFEEFQDIMNNYGDIPTNSKGGFSITSSDGKRRVTRERATVSEWDERSKKAETLIIEFLKDRIKDEKLHKLVMSFLERNKMGELRSESVLKLQEMKNDFDDPRWEEGLNLIQESYERGFKCYRFIFQTKNEETGQWNDPIRLNFSTI